MFKIKKQINTLYLTSVLWNLSITGAWVALLAARGFSLVQIGFAETVFHITSLIFEIPSGLLADVYGRKKMLIISSFCALLADLAMAFSAGFGMVCVSLFLRALAYNALSGSGDALAYDSMKLAGIEKRYEKYSSNQSVIYRVGTGISTLCAGLALMIGFKAAYLISAVMSAITLLVTCSLTEVRIRDAEDREEKTGVPASEKKIGLKAVLSNVLAYFAQSLLFLFRNGKAAALMFANSLVGAVDILLLFFLQSKLTQAGISDLHLGVALFITEIGGIVGARLILRAKKVRYAVIFILCSLGVMTGVLLEHTALIPLMTLGGFLSSLSDDAVQVRTDAKLQGMFPSEQRATLISISSFTFSVVMIVLSPLAGYFFSVW